MKIFVYGNMMRGFSGHGSFGFNKNAYYIGKTVLKGAAMYDMGLHPVVVLTGDERDTVVGELYEYLDITCHSRVRLMMECAGFEEFSLDVDGASVRLFIYLELPAHARRVTHGDWAKHVALKCENV